VYIHKEIDKAIEHNIQEKLENVANLIKIWNCRHLTLKGKVSIVNSLLLSQMLYIASVINIPQVAINKYNKMITNFIWNNKPAKIKYTTLIAPIAQGGLQLQDLETKIEANKITWIKNIINKEIKTLWKAYLQLNLLDPISEIPFHNLQNYDELKITDKFYKDMFKVWSKFNYREPNNIQEAIKQPLWRNSLIRIDN
jgi:hypothetical protein